MNNIDRSKYSFFKTFEAPQGDYRDTVIGYMLKMADYEWVAGEDFSITWKSQGDFKVSLNYEKGKKYYGVPYSQARATLDQFTMFANDGKPFTSPNYYYEEMVGNHCSSSIGLCYQQLIDFPFAGRLMPNTARKDVLSFVNGLERPDKDDYYTQDIFDLNGQERVFEAYASVQAGDIINKIKEGTGHARMAHYVKTVRDENGKIDPENSYVFCIEQTNEFDKTRTDRITTWWIDRPYSFQKLWNTKFMPVTLNIFHTKKPLEDAYIAFDKNNSPDTIANGLKGKVVSNFPLSYVRATVTDKYSKVVGEIYKYKFMAQYSIDLEEYSDELDISNLPQGEYNYELRAGIGRGGCIIESFSFEINK